MTEADLHSMYAGYLSEREYRAFKIPEEKTETPDLIIQKNHAILLNEFKAPDLIANQESAPFVYKFKTTLSKLRRNISKSVNQLAAYDPDHNLIWVVTFASQHSQLHWSMLENAIKGRIINSDGSVLTDLSQTHAFLNTEEKIKQPDLYMWLQVNSNQQIFQVSTFVNHKSLHYDRAKAIAYDLGRQKVSPNDNGPIDLNL